MAQPSTQGKNYGQWLLDFDVWTVHRARQPGHCDRHGQHNEFVHRSPSISPQATKPNPKTGHARLENICEDVSGPAEG